MNVQVKRIVMELQLPLKNQKIDGVVIIVQGHVINVVKLGLGVLKHNVKHAVLLAHIYIVGLL
jgi:hypothetical protein